MLCLKCGSSVAPHDEKVHVFGRVVIPRTEQFPDSVSLGDDTVVDRDGGSRDGMPVDNIDFDETVVDNDEEGSAGVPVDKFRGHVYGRGSDRMS